MPLPANSTISLQGYSIVSTPQPAMIVRMSTELLDALEDATNAPNLEFDFGDAKGFHLPDAFFPVRPAAEEGTHELYLRVSSARQPTGSLKLHANVVGKLMVERELGEKVQDKVRDRTLHAEKQRKERTAILLDTPPDIRPAPTKSAKGRRDAPAPRRAAPATAHASRVASPLPPPANTGEVSPARKRMVHCLAIRNRPFNNVLDLVGGKNMSDQTRRELTALLEEISEPVPKAKGSDRGGDKGEQVRQLKLQYWTEVRPFEWPNLSVTERTNVARQARGALKQLKIPESDPLWEHSRWREPESAVAGPSSSARAGGASTPVEPKRGIVAQSAKTAKKVDGARKKAAPSIIVAKDEGARAREEARNRDRDDASVPGTPTIAAARPQPQPARRYPGSGYKGKSSASPPATDTLPPPPASLPKKPVMAPERERERERDVKRESATPSLGARGQEHERKTTSVAAAAARIRQKEALSADRPKREKERERDRPSPAPKRKLAAEDESSYSERDVPLRASATKRRKVEEPEPRGRERAKERDSLPVPRKREPSPPSSPVKKQRDSPLPQPRPRVKKESSPLPPPPPKLKVKREPSPASPPSRDDSPAPRRRERERERERESKPRRRSPVHYTSSEDESEMSAPPPPPARAPKKQQQAQAAWKPQAALPGDRAGLRGYYKRCFLVYIRLYQRQVAQRARIEEMLGGGAEDEDAMDVDGDGEELEPEALVAFVKEMREVTEEMERIRRAYEKLGGKLGELGDEEGVDEES